jgi:hypothetical protein
VTITRRSICIAVNNRVQRSPHEGYRALPREVKSIGRKNNTIGKANISAAKNIDIMSYTFEITANFLCGIKDDHTQSPDLEAGEC